MLNSSLLNHARAIALSLLVAVVVSCAPASPASPTSSPPSQITRPAEPTLASSTPRTADSAPSKQVPHSFQAQYNAQGQLQSVVSADGKPTNDPAILQNFPKQLSAGIFADNVAEKFGAAAQFRELLGATVDKATGQLTLIGATNGDAPPLRLDDFVVAMRAVFADQDLGVSIDPIPSTREIMTVRYIGPVVDTHAGLTMFEADRRMKTLGSGKDNITQQPVTCRPPNFSSELSLALDSRDFKAQGPTWHRFWFVAGEVKVAESQDYRAMNFESVRMKVNTEYLGPDMKTPAIPVMDPIAQAFANELTDQYDGCAKDWQVFQELPQLTRWVSLAKWLKERQLTDDLGSALSSPIARVDTPRTTPAITVTGDRTENNVIRTVSIYGGVDLHFDNAYVTPPSDQPVLGQVATRQRPNTLTRLWRFLFQNREYQAAALSVNPLARLGDNRFALSTAQLRVPGDDSVGFDLYYDSFSRQSGPLGSGWSFGNPHLRFPLPQREYTSGRLYPDVILAEPALGQERRYIGPKIDSKNRTVYQANQSEPLLILERDGSYSLESQGDTLFFDSAGQLRRRQTTGGANVVYDFDGTKLTKVVGARGGRIELSYDAAGRVQQITTSSGEVRRSRYNSAGQIIEIRDAQDRVLSSFDYNDAGYLVAERDGQGSIAREFAYDDSGRLLAQWTSLGYVVFDWRAANPQAVLIPTPAGEPRVRLTESHVPRILERFGPEGMNDLLLHQRVQRAVSQMDGKPSVVYLQRGDQELFAVVGDRASVFPFSPDAVKNPARLRAELETRGLVPEGKLVIAIHADDALDLQSVFPERTVAYVQGANPELVYNRAEELVRLTSAKPEDTSVLIGIPGTTDANLPQELENIGLNRSDASRWQAVRKTWEGVVDKYKFITTGPGTIAERFRAALMQKPKVIVIVAHSDGETVYFPDKSQFKPRSFDQATRDAIARNRPVVILISCETALVGDGGSLALQLVEMGARAVIAPPGEVGARTTSALLDSFFKYSQTENLLMDAWRRAITETPGLTDINRLFRLIIGRALPARDDELRNSNQQSKVLRNDENESV